MNKLFSTILLAGLLLNIAPAHAGWFDACKNWFARNKTTVGITVAGAVVLAATYVMWKKFHKLSTPPAPQPSTPELLDEAQPPVDDLDQSTSTINDVPTNNGDEGTSHSSMDLSGASTSESNSSATDDVPTTEEEEIVHLESVWQTSRQKASANMTALRNDQNRLTALQEELDDALQPPTNALKRALNWLNRKALAQHIATLKQQTEELEKAVTTKTNEHRALEKDELLAHENYLKGVCKSRSLTSKEQETLEAVRRTLTANGWN